MSVVSTAKTLTKVTARLTNSLGSSIDAIWALREEKRKADEAVKVIEAKIEVHSEQILEELGKQGLDKATGKLAGVSISNTIVANVEDWEPFWTWIAKNKFFHLIQKRVSDPAYRELLEMGKKIPGVSPFTKRKLNVRSL